MIDHNKYVTHINQKVSTTRIIRKTTPICNKKKKKLTTANINFLKSIGLLK